MNAVNMHERIVRYGELKPCRTAFIDAHTPGSDQKENFTIIGAGVSESAEQHVHIKDTPGFNIGAAGQPPDMFRGFENMGTDYGMIMAVLGGDDAGGGVVWAPQVIEEASKHGLVLGDNGMLYDTRRGQCLPQGVSAMPTLTQQQVAEFQEPSASEVVPRFVARYKDMMNLASDKPASVLAANGMLKDKPGFEIELIKRDSISNTLLAPWLGRRSVSIGPRGCVCCSSRT